MRLEQLNLTRYGKFTDFAINFGDKITGPDLHLIYGPNEAGKSTTFAAILDLLYGIEKRSKYGFKHSYNTMQIDAVIELNGNATPFTRIKRDQQSLLDDQGRSISDAAILADLGGIDRHAFQTMFSLDDETLEQGGESILASRGQLGELLFSASSGLSTLSQRLADLRGESERFFKPRGHTHELAQQKKTLDALGVQSEAVDVAASSFAKLVEARQAATERYAFAMKETAAAKARLSNLQRDERALPKYLVASELRRQFDALPVTPDAPAGWADVARGLQVEATRLDTAQALNSADAQKVAVELSAIVVDENIRTLVRPLEDLQLLRARYLSSVSDLPARKTRKAETEGAIAGVLKRLECPPDTLASDLIFTPTIRGRLDDLLMDNARLTEQLDAAKTEHDRAELALREAEASISVDAPQPMTEALRHRLALAIDATQASDHPARKRLWSEDLRDKTEALTVELRALRPWIGDADSLAELMEPPLDMVLAWLETDRDLTGRHALLDTEIQRLESQKGNAEAQLASLRSIGGLVTDGEAQTVRRDREAAWLAHQTTFDARSASEFEIAMRHDDEVGATRLSHASDLARINELGVQKAVAEHQLHDNRKAANKISENRTALCDEVAATIAALSPALPQDWTPQQLLTWLNLRSQALATSIGIRKASAFIAAADADAEMLAAELADVLEAVGVDHIRSQGTAALLLASRERLDADTQQRARMGELASLKRDYQARETALKSAQASLDAWKIRWKTICSDCWLGANENVPTPSVVRRVFIELEFLAPLVNQLADLDYRVAAMEKDQREYVEAVGSLTLAHGFGSGLAPLDADRTLVDALADANAQALARDNALARQQELRIAGERLSEERKAIADSLANMEQHFGVVGLSAVLEKFAALAERQTLVNRIEAVQQDVLTLLDVVKASDAELRLAGAETEGLRRDVESLALQVENDEGRLRELFAEKCRCEDAVNAVDGDDAVARLEEQKRTLLLEIEDGALKWLRLKVGLAAAEQALRLYREQHRSSLLVRASEAFTLVSRNAYSSLSTQADKDGEVLVAIAKDGSSKRASDLSKGTRFQLYLALRVAGYQEMAERRRPVPFIADDILETFDDFRAEETLRVFGQMATFGQVIYLTHHRHLCDIARQVCPSVKIHELHAP